MIVRYVDAFLIGAVVDQRILICGVMVGAFVLTLAFSGRHDGLWRSDAAPSVRAAAQLHQAALTPTGEVARAVAGTMNPPPAAAPLEPVHSEPYSGPDIDDGETRGRRDRAAEHGSRSR